MRFRWDWKSPDLYNYGAAFCFLLFFSRCGSRKNVWVLQCICFYAMSPPCLRSRKYLAQHVYVHSMGP